jgi:CHAT domain-containing protein/Tfp pilus assembly protein PilF
MIPHRLFLHPVALACWLMMLVGCATPSMLATESIRKGDAANNQNLYSEAIGYYEQYIKLSPQLGVYKNPSMEADVYRKLAHAFSTQGKYNKAIECLQMALAIDTTLVTNSLEVGEDYLNLGIVHAYTGNYHQSLEYLERSLAMSQAAANSQKEAKKSALADTKLYLSQVQISLGNYAEAEVLATEALNLYNKIQNEKTGTMQAFLLLGIINKEKNNLSNAISLLEASKEIAEEYSLSTAQQNQILGDIYFLQGDPENGIRLKLHAINQAEKSNIKPQVLMAYMRLGDAYLQLGDNEKANDYYKKAFLIKSEMQQGDTLGFAAPGLDLRMGNIQKAYDHYMQSNTLIGGALVCLRIGEMQYADDNFDSAMVMYEQAKQLFAKSGSIEGVNTSMTELAKVHIRLREFNLAGSLLKAVAQSTIQADLKWQVSYQLGTICESIGKYDSAYLHYREAIRQIDEMRGSFSIEEFKTRFHNNKVAVYDQMITLLLKNRPKGISYNQALTEAFNYSEQSRSRTFLDMLGNNKIDAKSVTDTALLAQEQLLKLKIHQLTRELHKPTTPKIKAQLLAGLTGAQNDYDHLIEEIKLSNENYNSIINVQPPPLKEIQNLLNNETVLVEYWLGQSNLFIWVITNKNISCKIVDISSKKMQDYVLYCRQAIFYQMQEETELSRSQLSAILLKPIADEIIDHKYLVIVPHKDLHFLPYHMLGSDGNEFLIEKHIVNYSPSASVFYYSHHKQTSSGQKFLGVALGNLNIDDFSSLPGTIREIQEISKVFPDAKTTDGSDFSETFLKETSPGMAYLHIATHGVLNKSKPMYSYLVMASSEQDDGHLTVNEIFGLNLSAKLVTLSACETALGNLGEADDLIGLSRAFMYAGAPTVLVSLWKVDDTITASIMAQFYRYLQSDHSASEALALAQRDIIQNNLQLGAINESRANEGTGEIAQTREKTRTKTLRNPYFWAPFVLVGNGFIN